MIDTENDIIRLRPHHLFGCILTWQGAPAYEPAFDRYFSSVVHRMNQDPPVTVEIVDGPDDTCKVLSQVKPSSFRDFIYHCERPDIRERDLRALAEMSRWLTQRRLPAGVELPLKIGQRLQVGSELVKTFREGFKLSATRAGCKGCLYEECTRSADQGFKGTLLTIGIR